VGQIEPAGEKHFVRFLVFAGQTFCGETAFHPREDSSLPGVVWLVSYDRWNNIIVVIRVTLGASSSKKNGHSLTETFTPGLKERTVAGHPEWNESISYLQISWRKKGRSSGKVAIYVLR